MVSNKLAMVLCSARLYLALWKRKKDLGLSFLVGIEKLSAKNALRPESNVGTLAYHVGEPCEGIQSMEVRNIPCSEDCLSSRASTGIVVGVPPSHDRPQLECHDTRHHTSMKKMVQVLSTSSKMAAAITWPCLQDAKKGKSCRRSWGLGQSQLFGTYCTIKDSQV